MVSTSAQASLILDLSNYVATIDSPSNPKLDEIASKLFGSSSAANIAKIGDLLYKYGSDNTEEGPLASSYSGTITSTGSGSSTIVGATITYNGGAYADGTYLLVKSGNKSGSIIWDISGWDGKEQIVIGDVFDQNISHVEFFGSSVTPHTAVPEASSIFAAAMLILPFGFSVIRSFRKNR